MNRCFKPSGFGEPVKVQVHIFPMPARRASEKSRAYVLSTLPDRFTLVF